MNKIDTNFTNLIDYIKKSSKSDLILRLIAKLQDMKKDNIENYNKYVNYYNTYNFWGKLNPEKGEFDTFVERISILKSHVDDIVSLYDILYDYKSKYTLYAILLNWINIDTDELDKVKVREFLQYFDPDIFQDNKDDVFVDCGAYIGDTINDYINMYGKNYKKIYAYEIDEKNFETLKENINDRLLLENCVLKRNGVSCNNRTLSVKQFDESSANKLSDLELPSDQFINCITLDEDITEPITFIKMDIEGSEYQAISGAMQQIETYTPKLAIAAYHGYQDLFRIPMFIKTINRKYNFYLRHYGGNLIPTEFILYCKKKEA